MILTFVARPIAVLISLAPFDIDRPSKAFVSWAGIKGAVPIVFAFYPLVHGIYNAQMIFDGKNKEKICCFYVSNIRFRLVI